MKKRLTDADKLKYWLDTQFTILHILFAVVMLELTEGLVWTLVFLGYIAYAALYIVTRLAVIAADDPDYLRVPQK